MKADSWQDRIVVVTNPAAGRRRHRRLLPEIVRRLRASGGELRLLTATNAERAETSCREAVAGGARALVAVGGDGTMHAALQAVAGTGTPFAVLPAGTGNDFAAGSGVPADPLVAADAAAAALRTGSTRGLDLARITGVDGRQRWYGGVLAAGFDAIVSERANRIRWPRGDRRYDLAIFLELIKLRARHYQIHLDGKPIEVDAVLVAVGNTAGYGGGIQICPQAVPTDGLLDVVIGGRIGRWSLTRLRPKAYRGTHVDHPLVDSYRAATVEIAAEGVVGYADGERCLPLPVTVTCEPGALRVLSD